MACWVGRTWPRLSVLRIGQNNLDLARFELWSAAAHRLGFAQRQGRVAQTSDASSRPRTGWPCCCSWRKHSAR
jgi:hypothetical protein